jgi:serpin B
MNASRSIVFALLCLPACGSSSTSGAHNAVDMAQSTLARDPAGGVLGIALSAAVAANNAFAVDLYTRVRATTAGPNFVTSPLSASVALTMAYAGAKGDTASEMATGLHFDPSAGSIFDGQNALTQALAQRAAAALARVTQDAKSAMMAGVTVAAPSPSDFVLDVVNSVWGQKSYPWETGFLDRMARSYGAGIFLEDFAGQPEVSRLAINGWVSAQTAAKIQDLLPPGSIDGSTRMVIVDAIHLKLPWATPFGPQATAAAPFTRADGTTVTATFMHEDTELGYADGPAQIVALPFAGYDLEVVLALPHGDLAAYEAGLAAGTTPAPSIPTSAAEVKLSLPRIDFKSSSLSFADALKAMGMHKAFDSAQADFSGLCSRPPDGGKLYVGDVLQKAMLAIQENGVEAAAATAVTFELTSAPTITAAVSLDRPFLVTIVDRTTGAILFLGEIGDPTQGGP